MLAAIRFDDQAGFDASEIGDVGRNGVLPSEVPATQLPTPQEAPELALRVGRNVTHATGLRLC